MHSILVKCVLLLLRYDIIIHVNRVFHHIPCTNFLLRLLKSIFQTYLMSRRTCFVTKRKKIRLRQVFTFANSTFWRGIIDEASITSAI